MCPKCSSLERHRLLWPYLQRGNGLGGSAKKLLHVAPEPLFTRLLTGIPGIEYLSADLDSPLAMTRMDITDTQMPDCSFDVIVCCHVLEHIPNDAKAMSELRRISGPNGWVHSNT